MLAFSSSVLLDISKCQTLEDGKVTSICIYIYIILYNYRYISIIIYISYIYPHVHIT